MGANPPHRQWKGVLLLNEPECFKISALGNETDIYLDIENNDFRLKTGSPAIDSGMNPLDYLPIDLFPEYNFSRDIFGNPRLQGNNWDIGAHEYGDAIHKIPYHCEIDSQKVNLFPNPVKEYLTIDYYGDCLFEIFNYSGTKINETNLKRIDFTQYPSGLYIVKIRHSKGECPVKILKY